MSSVLVDSSVWIGYFNGGDKRTDALSELIDTNSVCVNDLILAELIPAIKHARENELVALLHSIACRTLDIDWEQIVSFQVNNLKNGINKVGIPDLIIMQHAIDNHLTLYTLDKHFELMAQHHKLKLFKAP